MKRCTDELEAYCTNKGNTNDQFWALLSEAVTLDSESISSSKEHPLVAKLNTCITLTTIYKETLVQLRDMLLQSGPFGLSTGTGLTRHVMTHLANGSGQKKGPSVSESSRTSVLSSSVSGISLHSTDVIMSDLSLFSARVLKVLDIIGTLSQFKQLNIDSWLAGLPRIAGLWNLQQQETGDEVSSIQESGYSCGEIPLESQGKKESVDSGSHVTMATPDYLEQLVQQQQGEGLNPGSALPSLKEESMVGSNSVGSSCDLAEIENNQGIKKTLNYKYLYIIILCNIMICTCILNHPHTDAVLMTTAIQITSSTTSTVFTTDSTGTHKTHSNSPLDSVALMIEVNIQEIQSKLELACGRGIEDVFSLGQRKECFQKAYQEYSEHLCQLEENLCAYLRVRV